MFLDTRQSEYSEALDRYENDVRSFVSLSIALRQEILKDARTCLYNCEGLLCVSQILSFVV